ncbi:MAG: non-ribosomal peptide synthetase, partial [Methylococcales bacterium]|nr:non-ribosomal peptide synthetase [Methylococcales bacterium]
MHHHLLMDGWSMPILLQEVFACYETLSLNQALQLPPARGFRDYIAWIAKQDNHKAEEFWKKALKGFSSPTPFFVDTLPKQQKQTGQGQKVFHVTERITQRLGELGKQNKLTLNTLVQGAWGILLNRYSGEDDVLFGAVVSGRPAELPGVDTMVGIFINTLPVRICFNEDESLLECLNELQANQADQRQYEYTPLAKIQQWSDVEAGQALFESILVFENFPVEQVLEQQNKGSLKVVDVMSSEQTNFPMTLIVSPGEQLTLEILYSKERFEDHVIDRLFGHFEKILARMIETMAQPVLNIPLLT